MKYVEMPVVFHPLLMAIDTTFSRKKKWTTFTDWDAKKSLVSGIESQGCVASLGTLYQGM